MGVDRFDHGHRVRAKHRGGLNVLLELVCDIASALIVEMTVKRSALVDWSLFGEMEDEFGQGDSFRLDLLGGNGPVVVGRFLREV